MVNVFATGEVERGLDSIFPVGSYLGLKNMIFISSIARVVSGSQGWIQDFKLGARTKKIAPSGGRRENCGCFVLRDQDCIGKIIRTTLTRN